MAATLLRVVDVHLLTPQGRTVANDRMERKCQLQVMQKQGNTPRKWFLTARAG